MTLSDYLRENLEPKAIKALSDLYRFPVPPVCTANWDDADWLAHIITSGKFSWDLLERLQTQEPMNKGGTYPAVKE